MNLLDTFQLPPRVEPLSASCESCGLFKTHAGPVIVQGTLDQRPERFEHRVLVITSYPTIEEAASQLALNCRDSGWVLDFLNGSDFNFMITHVQLCSPLVDEEGKPIPPTKKQLSYCSGNYLGRTVAAYAPHAILALGGDALECCWPAARGKAPSINKIRTTPIQLETLPGNPWLVTSYAPGAHTWWQRTDGMKGQNLTEEYIRTFELLHKVLAGKYAVTGPDYRLVQDVDELQNLHNRIQLNQIMTLDVDTENDTYFGKPKMNRLREEYPNEVIPDRLTIWHPDNKILPLGITFRFNNAYETYEISGDLLDQKRNDWFRTRYLLAGIFAGRTLRFWNGKSDLQDIYRFLGLKAEEICGGIVDGFFRRALRDGSVYENSLKVTAVELLSSPAWEVQLEDAVALVKKQLQKQKKCDLVSMGMIPREILLEYNAFDTFRTAELLDGPLSAQEIGEDFPWKAEEWLTRGLPWVMEMERNGLPIDEELLNDVIDELEVESAQLLEEIKQCEEVQRAQIRTQPYNLGSPIFFQALIEEFYGEFDEATGKFKLPYFPRTSLTENFPEGQLRRDQDTLNFLSGETVTNKVPFEEKTEIECFWFQVQRQRESKDDLTKLLALLDYTVDGRVHTNYRMLKTAGDDEEGGGGTVSGRFASSAPNLQNIKNDRQTQQCFRCRPGKVIVAGDYGQAELIWLAYNTGDPLMRKWAIEKKDQHRERGAALWAIAFNRLIEEFELLTPAQQKQWRGTGKTQNFAIVYQQEPETQALEMKMPLEEVLLNLQRADANHPKILEMKKHVYTLCNSGQFITTTLLGRRRSALGWQPSSMGADEFFSYDPNARKRRNRNNTAIFRSIWNSRGAQTDASDTAFIMGQLIHERLKSGKWLDPEKVKCIGFTHDDLKYEVDEDYVEVALPELQAMQANLSLLPMEFDLPISVDMKVGRSLADFLKEE